MRFFSSALFLVIACHGLKEKDVPEELRKNFDNNKLIIPTSREVGEELYANITIKAYAAILNSLILERIGQLPTKKKRKITKCLSLATHLRERAKCFVGMLQSLREMKKRRRRTVLKRIDVQIRRRKRQAIWDTAYAEKTFKPPKVTAKESYTLHSEKGGSALELLSVYFKKALSRLRGYAASPLRSWRSVAEELSSYYNKNLIHERLMSMLTSSSGAISASIRDKLSGNGSPESNGNFGHLRTKEEESALRGVNHLVTNGIKLLAQASGYDVGNKTIRILSPRFGKKRGNNEEISLLSPDVSPSSQENETLEGLAMMDLLMEVTGTTPVMQKLLDEMQKIDRNLSDSAAQMSLEDVEETLGKRERQKIEVMQRMEKTYTPQQMELFRKRGFAVMTNRQRNLMYGPTSPYYDESVFRKLRGKAVASLEREVVNSIRLQAIGMSDYQRRMKVDLVLSPIVAAGVIQFPSAGGSSILSPIVLSAFVSSPTVLGPVILSPWLLSALVLTPWALCPVILSPFTFVPVILSPVALSPYVLSPGIFSPLILSPLLMVPYILSPSLFNPVVLSPLALSPFVWSPTAGSPVILSPFVLSPVVFSPSYHSSLILSPSALSPAIQSDSVGSAVVLSPDIPVFGLG